MTDNAELRFTNEDGVMPRSGEKPLLNNVGTVDEILRTFAGTAMQRFGQGDPGAFRSWLDYETGRLNMLFLGLGDDGGYTRLLWNTPAKLGEHLTMALQLSVEWRFAVRDALVMLVAEVVKAADDPSPEKAIEAAIEAMAKRFCGLSK